VGLDEFIVNREDTPRDEEGDYDYEHLHSLDLELFNEVLLALMRGEEAAFPHYNFFTGLREKGETASITDEHMIIVEGIHGMNPALVPHIPPDKIFRIYVSALTQLNLDRHNRVATTDTRLLRRIIRDANTGATRRRIPSPAGPKCARANTNGFSPFRKTPMLCLILRWFTNWRS